MVYKSKIIFIIADMNFGKEKEYSFKFRPAPKQQSQKKFFTYLYGRDGSFPTTIKFVNRIILKSGKNNGFCTKKLYPLKSGLSKNILILFLELSAFTPLLNIYT